MGGNTLSAIAFRAMQQCLAHKPIDTTDTLIQCIVREMCAVPERPVGYSPTFTHRSLPVAIPVTGGLDSTVLYFRHRGKDCQTFYVDYGQPYVVVEELALHDLGIPYARLESGLAHDGPYWKHIVPGRNFYLLSRIVDELPHGGRIMFGTVDGEMPGFGGDKSVRFFELLNSLFARLPVPVRVENPLSDETKTDLVKWWLERNLGVELLEKTHSCFSGSRHGTPGVHHCGACQACLRKWIAFYNNGLKLKTIGDVRVGCAEYITKYRTLMTAALEKSDYKHYSQKRCIQDLAALKALY